jgi:hypothetical protein
MTCSQARRHDATTVGKRVPQGLRANASRASAPASALTAVSMGRSAAARSWRSRALAKSRLWRIRWTMHVWSVVSGKTADRASLIPFRPSVTAMRMS